MRKNIKWDVMIKGSVKQLCMINKTAILLHINMKVNTKNNP